MRTNRKKGFTITELVIVIAVIAVLAAVLIPTFASVVSSANESKAMQNCHNALTSYRADEDHVDVDQGMVLVNNEGDNMYAYVYLGGTLENLGKIGSLKSLESGKNEKALEASNEKVKFADENGHDGAKKVLTYKITTTTKDKDGKDVPSVDENDSYRIDLRSSEDAKKEDAESTAFITTGDEDHNELNLFFYTLELNDKTYFGWFTIEKKFDEALLTLEDGKVVYSNDFGYVETDGNVTVEFKDYEKPAEETKNEVQS